MIEVAFKILNKPWTIRVLKRSKYKKKNGSDSVAVTKVHKRQIDLGPKGHDLETVCHELTHAYLSEMCTHSADLTIHDLEEVFAELMAKRGYELLGLAEQLIEDLKRSSSSG